MNMNDIGNAKREMTSFERLVSQLESAVAQAGHNTLQYREKVGKLDYTMLESEQPVKGTSNSPTEPSPDTLMAKLNSLVCELERINNKNNEIISYFNSLI